MNAGNTALRAWDYLLDDAPEWIAMNAHKRKQANNNLNHADYLLAFAQYYPYGPQYYIFGGMYRLKKFSRKYLMPSGISLHSFLIMWTIASD